MAHYFHCIISGKVHGVWFRAATKRKAMQLKLAGWVQNLPDSKVAVYACGDELALQQLKKWLQRGPLLAQVTHIDYLATDYVSYDSFTIK